MKIGSIVFDEANRVLVRNRREVSLPNGEFRILRFLLLNRGRPKTREEICTAALGYEAGIYARAVDQHVYRLRRKLGPEAGRIVCVRGVGYRLT